MIEFLFLDLDDTILDFRKAESIAIRKTFSQLGVEPTDAVCSRYSEINKQCWERLERKELTREEVVVERFAALFWELGTDAAPVACARLYETNLSIGHYFLPRAEETLELLSKHYRLYLASNGTAKVQVARLESANISRFFEKIFISQEIGANKPSPEYFARCFAQIPGFDAARAMIVGDSLTSDIQGGINAGICTCWVNPDGKPGREDIMPDHEIGYLYQLPQLLEQL